MRASEHYKPSIHENDPDYIYNPATGRYILKDGRIGRQLVRAQHPEKYASARCKYGQKKGRICNVVTGKWVKPTGYLGKELRKKKSVVKAGNIPCLGDRAKARKRGQTVCNHKSGYWVKRKKSAKK